MKNMYEELKNRQQEEFNKFPIKFAFSKEQFKKSMEELGLNETDTDKIIGVGAGGGFIRLSDKQQFLDMIKRHRKEFQDMIMKDKTGNGFVKDMFKYELANHEYCITFDYSDTLDALGFTLNEVKQNPILLRGLKLARQEYLEECSKEEYAEI